MERKLAGNLASPSSATSPEEDRFAALEKERDELQKKLHDATRQIYETQSRNDNLPRDDLVQQLNLLRARLEVFESRKLPYTEEEQALMKQPALVVSKADPNAEKKSLRQLPRGAGPLLAEAERAFAARRFDEAEKKYLQVLRMDEKNVFTLSNLAASQLEQGRMDDSETNLKRALAIEPNDPHALGLLGIQKFRQEKYDEAFDYLSRAAQVDAQNPEIQNYLGITLSQTGQRGPAEAALRKAIQLAPGYAGAHHNLAVIYATQQPPFMQLARYHYQKALASGHPENADLEKIMNGTAAAKP